MNRTAKSRVGWLIADILVVLYAIIPLLWIISLSFKPASSVTEPGTTPPPQTRSNSATPVVMRGGSGVSDCRVSNWMPRDRAEAAVEGFMAPGGAERLSSVSVFHWPQALHWPDHLPWTAPQD